MSSSLWSRFYSPTFDPDQFFDDTSHPRIRSPLASYEGPRGSRMLRPRMDLHEDTDKNVTTATFELPGLSKDKVTIDVQNGNLVVVGEVTESTEKNEHGYSVRERRTGRFSRTVKLPEGVESQDINAVMENGVLTVTFPRSSTGQEPQRITIN